MTRGRRHNQSADSTGWLGAGGWLTHLLLVLFALRAVIPVGYMPDPAALQDGRFEIVVCTPAGLKTITVTPDRSGPGGAEKAPTDELSAPECPFQTVIAKALIVPDQIGAPLRWSPAALPGGGTTSTSLLRSSLTGPPLGLRAPPVSAL